MLQRSPRPNSAITEDEVRGWFAEVGCKTPGPNAINAIATHCSLIKARVSHPRLTDAAADIGEGREAMMAARAWIRRFEQKEEEKGVPLRSDLKRLADALDEVLPILDLHPSYSNPDKRWQTHIHLVADLIIAVRQVTGRNPAHKYGSAEGPTMKLICKVLHAIVGGKHDPEARLSWLKLNPEKTVVNLG